MVIVLYIAMGVAYTMAFYGGCILIHIIFIDHPKAEAAFRKARAEKKAAQVAQLEASGFEFRSAEYACAQAKLEEHVHCYNQFMDGNMMVDPFNHEEPEDWWAEKDALERECMRLNPNHRDIYVQRVSDGHFKPYQARTEQFDQERINAVWSINEN